MKKLIYVFMAFAAISFASCGQKTVENDATTDSDSVVVDTVDSVVVDSLADCECEL